MIKNAHNSNIRENWIIKRVSTSRNSTTVVTADPDLQFPMVAGRIYQIELVAHLFAGDATPDFKYSLTQPTSGAARYWFRDTNIAGANTVTVFRSDAPPTNQSVLINASVSLIRLSGTFMPSANGTWSFDWAQNTSNANDVAVLDGSYVYYVELYP